MFWLWLVGPHSITRPANLGKYFWVPKILISKTKWHIYLNNKKLHAYRLAGLIIVLTPDRLICFGVWSCWECFLHVHSFTSSDGVTTYGGLKTSTSTFPFSLGRRHCTCETTERAELKTEALLLLLARLHVTILF